MVYQATQFKSKTHYFFETLYGFLLTDFVYLRIYSSELLSTNHRGFSV